MGWVGSVLHSTSEASAFDAKLAPLKLRTSPPDRLLHRVITEPTPVPDTGVALHVAPPDDDVTVADKVGVAAAAIATVPSIAPPETSITTPTADSARISLVCPTVQIPPAPPCDHRT